MFLQYKLNDLHSLDLRRCFPQEKGAAVLADRSFHGTLFESGLRSFIWQQSGIGCQQISVVMTHNICQTTEHRLPKMKTLDKQVFSSSLTSKQLHSAQKGWFSRNIKVVNIFLPSSTISLEHLARHSVPPRQTHFGSPPCTHMLGTHRYVNIK